MKSLFFVTTGLMIFACPRNTNSKASEPQKPFSEKNISTKCIEGSWEHFLQNLPVKNGNVVDYKGRIVDDNHKAAAVIDYDIGTRDLQQCADAIMRLRAEYLFSKKELNQISFHFTSGQLYTFRQYLNGSRPVISGNRLLLINNALPREPTHASLRSYLDIVYTYAGTISLAKELQTATALAIGTIVIKAGSPGHCMIIVDEATNRSGQKVYKLVEGYTPAQSIYILKNGEDNSQWHTLTAGKPIETASYSFKVYKMGKYE